MSGKVYGDRKKEIIDFEIWPKVVPIGRETVLHVRSPYPHKFVKEGAAFGICIFPMEGLGHPWTERTAAPEVFRVEGGELRIPFTFLAEQEYLVEIRPAVLNEKGGFDAAEYEKGKTIELRVFALEADLFAKRPWKGDVHMHSHCSDGREAPGFVAASCRKIGLDFMAVTDHGRYAPSIEAQEHYSNVPVDMLICRGEEVHPPENPVHMIHFGGSESINDKMRDDPEGYARAVDVYEQKVQGVSDPALRRHIASCCWVFDQIRQAGGLGVFCHPYWKVREGYHIAGGVTSWMFENQPFDAYEIIGGYYKYEADSNTIQVARYNEERAKGRHVPIVGVSDAHGCAASDLFGWYYTISWSEELTREAVSEGIRQGWSVAVEMMEGEVPRAYGPFRLVKLALFLIREVFPIHDALCDAEGEAMFAHLRGEASGAEGLARLAGGVSALYEKLWS